MSWDLLGHEWAASLLKQHLCHEDVRHAYLFCGAPGIGRRSLALTFAQAINCQNPPAAGEACGECRACRQIEKMQHPDLAVVSAEAEGGMVKVDQIRALQRSLTLSPYEARFRIALLLNFQNANANAQNALLKTLEEAPRQVVLLMTADAPDTLLPTISSRCEILRLRPAAVEQLTSALQSRWNIPADQSALVAHLTGGRVGLARAMAANPGLIEERAAWIDELLRLVPLSIQERFFAVEPLARNRDQLRLILRSWLTLGRDLLLLVHDNPDTLTNRDREAELRVLSRKLSENEVLDLLKNLDQALQNLELNANLRLLLENLFLQIPRVS
jgi:DNA polymerase-3 subunit delta'